MVGCYYSLVLPKKKKKEKRVKSFALSVLSFLLMSYRIAAEEYCEFEKLWREKIVGEKQCCR